MPDISKINAVAIADIEKLDAVLAANIAKVNGLVFSTAPAFTGLLDTYTGAAAGYSTRRLASATTVLLRVRRDTGTGGTGDDDEADVAYDTNNQLSLDSAISNPSAGVTATTLGQFLNVGTVNGTTYTNPDSLTVTASCFVDEWKDQSGNAKHARQSVQGNQPQIHDGTVNTDLITENGKPAIYSGTGSVSLSTSSLTYSAALMTMAFKRTSRKGVNDSIFSGGAAPFNQLYSNSSNWQYFSDPTGYDTGLSLTSNQQLITVSDNGTSTTYYKNGSAGNTDSISNNFSTELVLFYLPQSNYGTEGNFQEFILWSGAKSDTDRNAIEGNQNAHFQIGNFGTPTSGLLFDYPDAAAAYSVRQLANTAALSMRVREDATDTETNIGFDANGDLDTAAIAAHCGSANGYVVNWFDQAGSQNDATQSTLASQPQIYNGTAVITENGKPAVDLDGNDNLRVLFASAFSQPNSYFVTATLETTASATVLLSGHTLNTERNQIELTSANKWNMYAFSSLTSTISGDTDQHLHNCLFNSSFSNYYLDGTSIASSSVGTYPMDGITIGARFTQTLGWNGTIQEVIMWPTNQDSNRTAIETDINTYFSIY